MTLSYHMYYIGILTPAALKMYPENSLVPAVFLVLLTKSIKNGENLTKVHSTI